MHATTWYQYLQTWNYNKWSVFPGTVILVKQSQKNLNIPRNRIRKKDACPPFLLRLNLDYKVSDSEPRKILTIPYHCTTTTTLTWYLWCPDLLKQHQWQSAQELHLKKITQSVIKEVVFPHSGSVTHTIVYRRAILCNPKIHSIKAGQIYLPSGHGGMRVLVSRAIRIFHMWKWAGWWAEGKLVWWL